MTRAHHRFTLQVEPAEDGGYGVELLADANGAPELVASLRGRQLERVRSSVLSAVIASNHARTVISPTRKDPIRLTEEAGVRLALASLATAPVSKPVRVESILSGIEGMTSEEALYWFAHCTGPHGARALRALRVLLADE